MNNKPLHFVRCLKCQKILQCSRYDTSTLLQHIRTDHPEIKIVDADSHDKIKGKTYKNQYGKSGEKAKVKTNGAEANEKFSQYDKEEEKSELIRNQRQQNCECDKNPAVNSRINYGSFHQPGEGRYSKDPQHIPDDDKGHHSIEADFPEKYPGRKDSDICRPDDITNVIYTKRYKIKTPSTVTARSPPATTQKHRMYRTTIEKWSPANGTIYCPKCGYNKRPLIKTRTERFTKNQCCACCLFSCWPFCFVPCLIPDKQVEYLHCSNCKTFLGIYNRNSNCIKPNREYVECVNEKAANLDNKQNLSSSDYHETTSDTPARKANSKKLPSIIIDGKELHPDMVARLQRFRKYGHLAGIDLDAVTDGSGGRCDSPHCIDSFRDGIPNMKTPSVAGSIHHKAN